MKSLIGFGVCAEELKRDNFSTKQIMAATGEQKSFCYNLS